MSIDYDVLLDAKHDDCPIPTIKTKQQLDEMAPGAVLKVLTSREGSARNLRTLANNNDGYELVRQHKTADGFHSYIRKL